MNNKIKIVVVTGILVGTLLIGAAIIDKNSVSVSKNIVSGESVKFKGDNNIDINNYNKLDEKQADIDKDGIREEILLLGKGPKYMLEEAYIVIREEETKKVLTKFQVNSHAWRISDIGDTTGDNVADILLESQSGGNAGGFVSIYVYENGIYKESGLGIESFKAEFLDGYRYKISEEHSGKSLVIDLSKKEREEYVALGIYNSDGEVTGIKESGIMKLIEAKLTDIDNDGVCEVVNSLYISGASSGDVLIKIKKSDKYYDGKFNMISFENEK